MALLVLFNKPFDVLCQFTDQDGRATLADYIDAPELRKCYPAGRLDRDSEGLVALTDNGSLQHQLSHPSKQKQKTYWVQVEGAISNEAIQQLCEGVELKDGLTRPAKARRMNEPLLWDRNPPVRYRASIPTSWIELTLREGKNRQVRRMTAAVGYPTLRLVRRAIGPWELTALQPGEYKVLEVDAPETQTKPFSRRQRNAPSVKRKNRPSRS